MTRSRIARLLARRSELALPVAPLARLRALCMGVALLTLGTMIPEVLVSREAAMPLRLAAVAGLIALGALWVRGYRRGSFGALADIPEAALLVGAALLVPPTHVVAPLFGMIIRSLYGSLSQSLLRIVLYSAVVALISAPADVVTRCAGLVAAAVLMQVLLSSLVRQEEGEEAFRLLEGAKDHAIFMLDAGGCIQSWNSGAERVMGYPAHEILGRGLDVFYSEEDRAAGEHAELLERVRREGSVEGEGWRVRRDGSRFYVLAVTTAIYDQKGRTRGFAVIHHDIDAQHEATRELWRSEERLRRVVESAGIALGAIDGHGVVTLVAGTRVGDEAFDAGAIVDNPLQDALTGAPELIPLMRRAQAGEAGVLQVASGDRTLEVGFHPVRDEHDRPDGFIGVATDVSDRVRAEEMRRQLDAELHRAQRLETVGQLAGGVAHDFNNILAVVLNYGALVTEELEAGSDAQRDVAEICRAAERGAQLTRQLLLFSRRERTEAEVLDLSEVVRGTQGLVRGAVPEHIDLRFDLAADLPAVQADPGQLEQVILNLAVNARDAMPKGGNLTFTTSAVGGEVRLEVADSGCGMPPEVVARVFEPFFTTKGRAQGTGLGLASAYGIVQESGGRIEIESEVGVGTRMRILLPACARECEESDEPVVAAPPPRGEGLTVLLAEDEPAVAKVTTRMLHRHGYRVLVAVDGLDALRVLDEHDGPVDLLLSDITMPGLRGPDLAARFSERHPDGAVVFTSGYAEGELDPDVELVAKPFGEAALLDALGRALDARSARPAAGVS